MTVPLETISRHHKPGSIERGQLMQCQRDVQPADVLLYPGCPPFAGDRHRCRPDASVQYRRQAGATWAAVTSGSSGTDSITSNHREVRVQRGRREAQRQAVVDVTARGKEFGDGPGEAVILDASAPRS